MISKRLIVPLSMAAVAMSAAACQDGSSTERRAAYDAGATQSAAAWDAGAMQGAAAYDAGAMQQTASAYDAGAAPGERVASAADRAYDAGAGAHARDPANGVGTIGVLALVSH